MPPPDSPPTVNAAQVAVLAERVDAALNVMAEIKGLIMGISQRIESTASGLAVLQDRHHQHEESLGRAFRQCDDLHREMDGLRSDVGELRNQVAQNNLMWKQVGWGAGAAVTICMAVCGWLVSGKESTMQRIGTVETQSAQNQFRIGTLESNQRIGPSSKERE